MSSFLFEPNFYNWLVVAGILFIIEVSTFMMIFLWIGLAATLVAAANYFVPEMSFTIQLLIFSIASLLSAITWFNFEKKKQQGGKETINNRSNRYIGKIANLVDDSKGLIGRVQFDDSFWKVQLTEDLTKGEQIRIIEGDSDGLLLPAEKYEPTTKN